MSARPLVAVLIRVPLLLEGLRHELGRVAEIRAIEVRDGESAGLLASIRPDAVVVAEEEPAEAALAFSQATDAPALYLRLAEQTLEVARAGRWERLGDDLSPGSVRNALAGELFGRARA